MGATQPCFLKQKLKYNRRLGGLGRLGVVRLDQNLNKNNNKTISACKSNRINISIKKTYNKNKRINSLHFSTQRNNLNNFLSGRTIDCERNLIKSEFDKKGYDKETFSEIRCSIIKKKKKFQSPVYIKRANLYNIENFFNKKNFSKGILKGYERFSTVYTGLYNNGEIVTIKEYKNLSDSKKKLIIENKDIIFKLNHPNIVKIFTLYNDYQEFSIVFESLNLQNVEQLIDKFGTLDEKVIQMYTKQLLEGLQYLHKRKIYHKNLKPTNILVDIDGTIKISDYLIDGIILGEANEIYNNLLNSDYIEYYIPPFFIKSIYKYYNKIRKSIKKNNEKSTHNSNKDSDDESFEEVKLFDNWQAYDLWFVGCILIEVSSGKKPWCHYNFKNNLELFNFLNSTNLIPTIPKKISFELRELIQALLNPILITMENVYEIIFDLNFFKVNPNSLKYQRTVTNITSSIKKSNNDFNDSYNFIGNDSGKQLGQILANYKVTNILNNNNNASYSISVTVEDSSFNGSGLGNNLYSSTRSNKKNDFRNKVEMPLNKIRTIQSDMPEVKEDKNEQSPDDKNDESEKNFTFIDFEKEQNLKGKYFK